MALLLGLDLGVSSIGWGLIDTDYNQIKVAGSRIFQAGVNVQPTGKEESKNLARRDARQIRRQIFRKKQRQDLLLEILQALRWFPHDETYQAMIFAENPYQLRKKALDEKLSLQELGRVFYHLSKRRGFKSSRKSGGGDDEGVLFKGKDDKKGISELQKAMLDNKVRTIGEYFATLNPHEIRIRNRYILRQQYLHEFEQIWNSQVRFHTELTDADIYQSLIKKVCKRQQVDKWKNANLHDFLRDYVMYYQRALKSQKGLVGNCSLEPKCKKAPLSALSVQEFRIWDKLHSFRIVGADRNNSPLSKQEKCVLFEKLNISKEQTVEQLLKLIKLGDYEVNFKKDEKIKGNRTANALIQVFGKTWANFTNEEKEQRWKLIYDAEDNDFLVKYGIEKWQLPPESAEKLRKVSFESRYSELSQRAIRQLLPLMSEQDLDLTKAKETVGYLRKDQKDSLINDKLGEPENLRNPIVQQGLFELRRVINTLMEEYKIKPDVIRIELARELKMPKKKRESTLADNKRREREHDRIYNILKQDFGEFKYNDPTPDDIVKYKLYEECQHICPYTGYEVGISTLFSGEFEVEHIIPFSRSLDDSFQNKTLCHYAFNKLKGKKIPYEMFRDGDINEAQYDEILTRAKTFRRNSEFNYNKFKKFTQREVSKDMVANQLNDTAYLSREAKAYLENICTKVQVSKGGATATLRHIWGLDSILNKYGIDVKNRNDHRHHALDALVVAVTSPDLLQNISKNYQKGRKFKKGDIPTPWEGFRNDLKDAINDVLIAHRHRNRVRGKLHDETFYGKVKDFEGKQQTDEKGQQYFKARKPVSSLSAAMIMKVAEPARSVILERLASFGVVPINGKIKEIPATAFKEPLWMPNKKGLKIPIKKVSVHDVSSNKIEIRKDTFVDSGSNHHIVIFEKPNGKRDGRVVSLFEATQRKKRGLPVINTDCGEDNEFVMSLSINEMVLLDTEIFKTADIDWQYANHRDLSEFLYRVQKIDSASKNIAFRHHLVAVLVDEGGKEPGRKFANPNTFNGIKVKISPIGEISKA